MEDGLDVEAIDRAIQAAKADPRPSIIMVRTVIGYGLPTRAGTAKAHGEPPGDVELDGAKDKLGWPKAPRFYIPTRIPGFLPPGAGSRRTLGGRMAKEAECLPPRLP